MSPLRHSLWSRLIRCPASTARRRPAMPRVEALEDRCTPSAGFVETNLVSDIPGFARHTDGNLVNPWGFAETPQGQFRVSSNGAGESLLIDARGNSIGQPVVIPTPSDAPAGSVAAPNGASMNTTPDFVIHHGLRSAPASFLFSTEDGTIVGFNPKVDPAEGVIGADLSDTGAVFKLLAQGTDAQGNNVIFATDFHNDQVDVFDKNFQLVNQFTDPNPHAGFAPFGVKQIDGTLFVTYAKQLGPDNHDDQEGAGNGFIDEFHADGTFAKRFATGSALPGGTLDALNSPIGQAVAPSHFGNLHTSDGSPILLVGNFGSSQVSAFNLNTGDYLGQLSDRQGNPLVLNGGFPETNKKGLWGIALGNGKGGADSDALFFAAGINQENNGLFGRVDFVGAGSDDGGSGHGDGGGKGGSDPSGSSGHEGHGRAALSRTADALLQAASAEMAMPQAGDHGARPTSPPSGAPSGSASTPQTPGTTGQGSSGSSSVSFGHVPKEVAAATDQVLADLADGLGDDLSL